MVSFLPSFLSFLLSNTGKTYNKWTVATKLTHTWKGGNWNLSQRIIFHKQHLCVVQVGPRPRALSRQRRNLLQPRAAADTLHPQSPALHEHWSLPSITPISHRNRLLKDGLPLRGGWHRIWGGGGSGGGVIQVLWAGRQGCGLIRLPKRGFGELSTSSPSLLLTG